MELTEDLLKILQLIIAVIGALAIFLIFISYEITVEFNKAERNSFILADAIAGNDCLTEKDLDGNNIKGLFSEENLYNPGTLACLKSNFNTGRVSIETAIGSWAFEIGTATNKVESKLTIAVKSFEGNVYPGELVVEI